MRNNYLIDKIREYLPTIPINKAYIFGSYARNEASVLSDIDLLVEVDYTNPVSLIDFIGWANDLQKITKKKVDLVSDDGLSIYLKPQIYKEKKMIYEKVTR